jgi:hypothetical protein
MSFGFRERNCRCFFLAATSFFFAATFPGLFSQVDGGDILFPNQRYCTSTVLVAVEVTNQAT